MSYNHFLMPDFNAQVNAEGIKVYSLQPWSNLVHIYGRRNFYKICLLSGKGEVEYDSKVLRFDGSILLISAPGTFCTWKLKTISKPLYTCVFTQEFFDANCFRWIEQSRLFRSPEPPVFELTDRQSHFYYSLLKRMESEYNGICRFKNNLIQSQVCVLLHSAIQLTPSKKFTTISTPNETVLALYIELMEMQFANEGQVLHFN